MPGVSLQARALSLRNTMALSGLNNLHPDVRLHNRSVKWLMKKNPWAKSVNNNVVGV